MREESEDKQQPISRSPEDKPSDKRRHRFETDDDNPLICRGMD